MKFDRNFIQRPENQFFRLCATATVALVLSGAAQATELNFESVGPQNSGLDSTAYFASYGITMTQNFGGPTGVSIFTVPNSAGTEFQPTSGTNFIGQDAPGANPAEFQLVLPSPGSGYFSFWRVGYGPPGFTNLPQMTATFYDGASNLGSVTANFQFDPSPQFFSFAAPAGTVITKAVFDSNGFGVSGIGGSTLDDISFSPTAPVTITGLPGGTEHPTKLPPGQLIGQIKTGIGGATTKSTYEFYWPGGYFSANARIDGAKISDVYFFMVFDPRTNQPILNPFFMGQFDLFAAVTGAVYLSQGEYGVGFNCVSGPSGCPDPLGIINFDTPVEGIGTPIPASLPLYASGLTGLGWLARRRWKRASGLTSGGSMRKFRSAIGLLRQFSAGQQFARSDQPL